MIRIFASLTLLTSVTAAAQTAGGPPIGYVKQSSNGEEIHLVTPQGNGHVLLYKAPSRTGISMLDLRPGGGEIAFLEAGSKRLRILRFDDLGRAAVGYPKTIRTVVSPCVLESPDYHPSDGSLIFVHTCGLGNNSVWRVQSGADLPDPNPLISNVSVFRARWSRLGDQLYTIRARDNASPSDPSYLYRSAPNGAGLEELGVIDNWSTFDITRSGNRVVWGSLTFQTLDLDQPNPMTSQAVNLPCPQGRRMTFGPGDSDFVYTTSSGKQGDYVMIGPANCNGTTALTGKGSWGWIDWRN